MAGELANDQVHITAEKPRMQLEGTEASAGNFSLKEDAGVLAVFDEKNTTALFSVAANQPVAIEIPIPVIFERPTSDLAAGTTGVRFETQTIIPGWLKNSATAAVEASWTASGAASETRVELWDDTAGVDVASVSGNTGSDQKSAYGDLAEGHTYQVRVIVAQQGGSADTTACQKAVVYERVSFA